MPLTKKKRA